MNPTRRTFLQTIVSVLGLAPLLAKEKTRHERLMDAATRARSRVSKMSASERNALFDRAMKTINGSRVAWEITKTRTA